MMGRACRFTMVGVMLGAAGVAAAQGERVVVWPVDTGAALVNPQMGWTLHYYSNIISNYGSRLAPSDTLEDFPGLSCIYLRLPWSFIEPAEGEFNWSIVDTPAQRWIDRGMQVAFRFSCAESWLRWATPEWVARAGAKGYNFSPGKMREDGPFWEPDYGDPVFLEKLDHFLAAAAKRYDGNPNVAFIDVGSFGVWGEGHTFSSTQKKYSTEVIKKHINLHVKHFRKTLLAANDDYAFHDDRRKGMSIWEYPGQEIMMYAFEKGLTLRDDSILVQPPPKHYFNAHLAKTVWRERPVVLECQHYGASKNSGAWGDGSKYLEAVEDYHASYVSIHWWPREFLKEQRELIDRINRRLGYRLQLREVSWPKRIRLDERFTFRMGWCNAGVAPCYPGGYAAVTLKDGEGGIVAVWVDESFDMRELQVGPADQAPVATRERLFRCARNMKAGDCEVYISVGHRDGTPVLALPLAGSDGHRRYRVGRMVVAGGS